MLRVGKSIAQSNTEILKPNAVQEHVYARKVVSGQFNVLTKIASINVFLPNNLGKPKQKRTGTTSRVAQVGTMDTRPQCGAAPSDRLNTGYELGFLAGVVA